MRSAQYVQSTNTKTRDSFRKTRGSFRELCGSFRKVCGGNQKQEKKGLGGRFRKR
jgi:hypothetical protein